MFPAPLEVWVGSYLKQDAAEQNRRLFPSPLEAWVVSYIAEYLESVYHEEFPSPLEAWVGSYLVGKKEKNEFSFIVSGPYRGMCGFLRW